MNHEIDIEPKSPILENVLGDIKKKEKKEREKNYRSYKRNKERKKDLS